MPCNQCGKIFQSRNLTEHKRGVHTNKNRLLAIKRRLKSEVEGLVKTEFKIWKFKCEHCDKIFKFADDLNMHIENLDVAGKYSCAICEEQFRYKAHFHFSGEYSCIGCKEQFQYKAQLNEHISSKHTCKHCDKIFKSAYDLNMHIENIQMRKKIRKLCKKVYNVM